MIQIHAIEKQQHALLVAIAVFPDKGAACYAVNVQVGAFNFF